MKIFIVVFLMIVSASAIAQKSDIRQVYECHEGDVKISTIADLEWLREQDCMRGNVAVMGLTFADGKQFGVLDFGELKAVYGTLTIVANIYLKKITAPSLKYIRWLWIFSNPMLSHCEAQQFIDDHGRPGYSYRGLNSGFTVDCEAEGY